MPGADRRFTRSLKELSKAIVAYIAEPTLPLPEHLTDTIAAYLRRHEKYDDAAADRLHEELMSIWEKHARGHQKASGPWIAILRRLLPMIQTPERVLSWLEALRGILSNHAFDKGTVTETVAALTDMVTYAAEYEDAPDDATHNPIINWLFSAWMDRFYPGTLEGMGGMEHIERQTRDALTLFGKLRPQKRYRKYALRFLCDFIQSRPPHLHQIMQVPLFGNLLACLQEDTSTSVISSALTALIMLLPHMPSSLVPHLPALFNIYARVLFWNRQSPASDEPARRRSEGRAHWEVCTFEPGVDDTSILHLSSYYTILYGLYPINFMDYIRKPQRYLRHANAEDADEIEVQPTEIRQQSEQFSKCHVLHPNFYTLTIDSEKTDFGRWLKSEAAEVVAECQALYLSSDPWCVTDDRDGLLTRSQVPILEIDQDREVPDPALLSSSLPTEFRFDGMRHDMGRTGSAWSHRRPSTLMRHNSQSSVNSNRDLNLTEIKSRDSANDGSGLITSSSHTQLQDMIQSNKAIKSALNLSAPNDSEASLASIHKETTSERPRNIPGASVGPQPSAEDVQSRIAVLQRHNLMLQNDLSFERYQKQQHIAHIGELRRKLVAEAATEAETQNLILMNRSLKSRYEDAKKAEIQVRKESEKSRAMAKKWEADLSTKMKNLREQSQATSRDLQAVRRELEDAKVESEKLRKLVCDGEVRELNGRQNLQAMEIHGAEAERLRAELARLTTLERDYQAEEEERQAALKAAAAAEAQVENLRMKIAAKESELRRVDRLFHSQVSELQTELMRAQQQDQEAPVFPKQKLDVEKLLAGSRARQETMQKQYDMLMRKYTALQSSLLDLESGNTSEMPKGGGRLKTRPHRVLSNPEMPEPTSYNVTPPLDTTPGTSQRPSTPPMTDAPQSSNSPDQRYHGRGGVQNRMRKETKGKQKEDEAAPSSSGKKEKKSTGLSTGLRGIRGLM